VPGSFYTTVISITHRVHSSIIGNPRLRGEGCYRTGVCHGRI